MQNKYDVTINNFIDGYAFVDNTHNHLLINIKKIKEEKCFVFVFDSCYNDTRVKILLMVRFHIDENNNLKLTYKHTLKFRTFKNYSNKIRIIDNVCFLYKKVIRKLKRNKINIYYVKQVIHSNELS